MGKRLLSVVLCIALLAGLCASALAAEDGPWNEATTPSVFIKYQPGGITGITGAVYRLYKVADVVFDATGGAQYETPAEYQSLPVNLDGYEPMASALSGERTSVYADSGTLLSRFAGYVNANAAGLTILEAETVDGVAAFEDLAYGLYVGSGPQYRSGNTVYTPTAFLLSVPYVTTNRNGTEHVANANLTVTPKFTSYRPNTPNSVTPSPAVTPDTEIPDEDVPLSEIIDDPNVEIVDDEVPLAESPDDHPDIVIDETDVPLAAVSPRPTNIPDQGVPLGPLPQTGLLWWPVPLLALCGLLLLAAGWKLRGSGGN